MGLRRCDPPHKQPPLISEITNTPGILQEPKSCRQGIVMDNLKDSLTSAFSGLSQADSTVSGSQLTPCLPVYSYSQPKALPPDKTLDVYP